MKSANIIFQKRETNVLASAKPGEYYRVGPALYLVVESSRLGRSNLVNLGDGSLLGDWQDEGELANVTPLPVIGPLTVSITAVEE